MVWCVATHGRVVHNTARWRRGTLARTLTEPCDLGLRCVRNTGTRANFAVDSASYIGSALCVLGVQWACRASATGYSKVEGDGAEAADAEVGATPRTSPASTDGDVVSSAGEVAARGTQREAPSDPKPTPKDGLCTSVAGGVVSARRSRRLALRRPPLTLRTPLLP